MSGKEMIFEKLLFGFRLPILVILLGMSVFLGYNALRISMDTSITKMVPLGHEYIKNLMKHKDELSLGNDIRIAVETTGEDIFTKEYLQTLKEVTDEAFYLPGVDRSKVSSIWTPHVRWVEVTEEGFKGGEVVPPTYDGSDEQIAILQQNILKSGQVGRLIADDFKSAIVYVPLVDLDPAKGEKHDYKQLSAQLEEKIRDRFQSDKIKIHIIGFGKKVGDLMEGAKGVAIFFLVAVAITFVLLILDTHCIRSSVVVLVGSITAVVWQLGLVTLLHDWLVKFRASESWPGFLERFPSFESIQFGIDPYSMLVPFLVFAIAVSHGVQYVNEMAVRVANGNSALEASKRTFRLLWIPGILALASDAIGFITLWFIDVGVIRELAITASVGVATIILTKLVFVPILLSYIGIGRNAVIAVLRKRENPPWIWRKLSEFADPRIAAVSIISALILAGVGVYYKQGLKIGDLDPGAPELRADSRYNLDDKYISENYSISADVLVVLVETPENKCTQYGAMAAMDRLMWHMENVPGVQSALSLVTVSKLMITGFNEGNLKWASISKIEEILNSSVTNLPVGLTNLKCSLAPVIIFLDDHKAETLDVVVAAVETFAKENNDPEVAKFVLASGNAGVEAATNQTIAEAEPIMLALVYLVVCTMVFITFRSWRPVVCIILPLILTSILCEALMTMMGIGVKVATLPVIALGVGIGVDYGIYIFSKLQSHIDNGLDLKTAYFETLRVTGKSVVFTGITLGFGVGTWIFSDIKFQADMGLLLTFMFVWNMVGAIWLLPALADFLIGKKDRKDQRRKARREAGNASA